MTDTYTTKLDMQTGTINICGGDTRFQFVIDEVPEIIESLKSEYERAKAIMGNPLLDTEAIDEAMKHYNYTLANGVHTPTLRAFVENYQNTLVMLRELTEVFQETIDGLTQIDSDMYNSGLKSEIRYLREWQGRIAAILEAHKHNMPAIVED